MRSQIERLDLKGVSASEVASWIDSWRKLRAEGWDVQVLTVRQPTGPVTALVGMAVREESPHVQANDARRRRPVRRDEGEADPPGRRPADGVPDAAGDRRRPESPDGPAGPGGGGGGGRGRLRERRDRIGNSQGQGGVRMVGEVK